MSETQLTLNFDKTIVNAYPSCREYVQTRVHQQNKQVQLIAADMDYSPSDLARKLAQSPNDSRRFTLDDLESYIEKTKDIEPVIYLAAKYLYREDETALRRQLAELQARLDEK